MSSRFFTSSAQYVFFLMLPFAGACSFAGQMAKESVDGATSYYSGDHFTLIATIPAKFGFTSKAKYSPKDGEKCDVYSPGLGGNVTRRQQKSNTTDAKDVEQTVSADIPLEYHIAGCSMELTRVSYELTARYGAGSLDRDLELAGGITVIPIKPGHPPTEYATTIEQRGLCSWLFKLSNSKIKKGEIEKILSCNATDESWKVPETVAKKRKPGGAIERAGLVNKTIKIEFRLSTDEEPAVNDTWVKTPGGWKPCLGKGLDDPYGFCRGNTTDFRTFKLNGSECTVYPTCN